MSGLHRNPWVQGLVLVLTAVVLTISIVVETRIEPLKEDLARVKDQLAAAREQEAALSRAIDVPIGSAVDVMLERTRELDSQLARCSADQRLIAKELSSVQTSLAEERTEREQVLRERDNLQGEVRDLNVEVERLQQQLRERSGVLASKDVEISALTAELANATKAVGEQAKPSASGIGNPTEAGSDSGRSGKQGAKHDAKFWDSVLALAALKQSGFASVMGETYVKYGRDAAVCTHTVPDSIGALITERSAAWILIAKGEAPSGLIERRKTLLKTKGLPDGWSVIGDENGRELAIEGPTSSFEFDVVEIPELYDYRIEKYFTEVLREMPAPHWALVLKL